MIASPMQGRRISRKGSRRTYVLSNGRITWELERARRKVSRFFELVLIPAISPFRLPSGFPGWVGPSEQSYSSQIGRRRKASSASTTKDPPLSHFPVGVRLSRASPYCSLTNLTIGVSKCLRRIRRGKD